MTTPLGVLGDTAVSTPRLPDEAAVIALNIPGEVFVIRPGEGQPEALITRYDLSRARIGGNPVSPVWSNPQTVIGTYGLGELVETCTRILRDLFGTAASVRPDIGQDPESLSPSLILWLRVPRSMRHLRDAFFDRYVRETVIPDGAPIPVLQWEYFDAVPA